MAETYSQSAALEQAGKGSPTAARLLAQLKHAHEVLLREMAELERITRDPTPEENRFTKARWRLSRASLDRRMLWTRILGYLRPRVGERGASDLRRLQDTDIELLRTSTRHVARWTTENALADWRGYREASRVMRGKMASAIEEESHVLYLLLEAVSREQVVVCCSAPDANRPSRRARMAKQKV